ncbi:uncharacterized protein LOC123565316 [Mercenaria mercenaria]|uniref:uncharacterized protein LOC123565316 n=1 Tax=Mercenaria mercenaria TaxID=6596 RepID=UPI00234FA8B8|nr:uncharacterized protein LOC123565316 [Mercenaria mercenaria]
MASGTTPSKTYVSIQFTPTTKKLICLICGKKEVNDKYRVKLFKSSRKSEACSLIERLLDISIFEDQCVNSVCQNCFRSISTLKVKLQTHKENYEQTILKLQKTHGRVSKKRLPFENVQPVTNTKKPNTDSKDSQASNEDLLSQCDSEKQLQKAINIVVTTIQQEMKCLCSKENKTILRSKTEDELSAFSWSLLSEEMNKTAPVFWQILQKSAYNPRQSLLNKTKTETYNIPGIGSVACKLVSLYNRELNAVQRMNSLCLLRGGAKKSAFRRLNATNDCLGYQSTLLMADQFGLRWESDLKKWVKQVDSDRKKEARLLNRITSLEEDSMFIEFDDPVESVHTLFMAENLKAEMSNLRSTMHSGYYFVGDNVDMKTKVRQMTLTNQNKDHHMYQVCAYKNRISGNDLDNTKPIDDIENVKFERFLPDDSDKVKLKDELSLFIAWQWTQSIPVFKPYQAVLPKYINHPYIQQTCKKTEKINMGVLMKNEQYNEDMTDICTFVNQFVPGDDESTEKPEKILSGGDYLTFERHKQAQSAKRNGRTPMKRMEGLVPKMEEFHNQAEFLQVIWKILYSTASSKDTGTLYAARNSINAKNVSKDPAANYYGSSELIDKYTKAYIICAALHHFEMDNLESHPKKNEYLGRIGNEEEMKNFILSNAKVVVETFTNLDFPKIPPTGYQSNNIKCPDCGKKYLQIESLRKHELEVHSRDREDTTVTKPKVGADDDCVFNYTKVSMTLGLLKLNHDNAIKMGDGERIIRLDKIFYLFYKAFNCTKYAYGMLETLLQTKVLLSERHAQRLVWNRTVNNAGEIDTNLPNDLDIEHCNKVFKDEAHIIVELLQKGCFSSK